MFVLVASGSLHRQAFCRLVLERAGYEVGLASGGIECVEQLSKRIPDALVLETPLPWGGSDGVLDVLRHDRRWKTIPVILLATGWNMEDWFELSRFRIDDFLFRVPSSAELRHAVAAVVRGPKAAPAAPTAALEGDTALLPALARVR
jgi:DNA-binding response OmpR family regulator